MRIFWLIKLIKFGIRGISSAMILLFQNFNTENAKRKTQRTQSIAR